MKTIVDYTQEVKDYINKSASTSGDPKTVSYANIVSIKDGAGVLAKDVSIKIEPVQAGSGTPSPDNIRAISGWSNAKVVRAGKNLVTPPAQSASSSGLTYDIVSEGVKIAGTSTATWSQNSHVTTNYFTLKKGVQYIFSLQSTDTTDHLKAVLKKKIGGNLLQISNNTSRNITLDEDTEVSVFNAVDISGYTIDTIAKNMIRLASDTDDTHEPYTGNDYTIDLGGTIYGGTLDVTSGKLTVNRSYVEFDGSNDENWVWASNNSLFGISVNNAFIVDNTTQGNKYTLNNLFPDVSWAGKTGAGSVGLIWGSSKIFLKYSALGSAVSDLKSFLASNPLQVVYKLATPITVQLTPTQIRMLAGVNTIYADTGDTQVEYFNASVGNLGEVLGDVQVVADYAIETGVKNLLPDNGTSQTIDGVTFTVNSDGSVTANGTATATIYYRVLYTSDKYPLTAGKQYKLSGCPDGGGDNTYKLQAEMNGQAIANAQDVGNGATFTAPEFNTRFAMYIRVPNGSTVSNKLFKPMITDANIPDSDYAHYQPYAKTNRELTQEQTYKNGDVINISSNPLYLPALFQDATHLRLTIPTNKPISASGATVTINSMQVFNNGNYEEVSTGLTATVYKVDGIGLYVIIENAANFTTYTALANSMIRLDSATITFT